MDATARMMDANTNRASEAARTLEDLARFVLNDADLAHAFKTTRRSVLNAVRLAGWSDADRIEHRDATGDVGVAHSQADAHYRSSLADTAGAAGSRLTEALRVLEEICKTQHADAAAEIEHERYAAYDQTRSLVLRLSKPNAAWPLCVLISEELCAGRDWLWIAEDAVRGGAGCIQLREKHCSDRELTERARRLVDTVRPLGAAVIINDRPDIAKLVEADGVHLGQDDLDVLDARKIVGERRLIGVSCSTLGQARLAEKQGADMLGLGPMFPSATKPKPRLAGPDLIRAVLSEPTLASMPHLAISGINETNAGLLAAEGCRGVAVSSAVCGAADPGEAAARILRAINPAAETAASTHGGSS